MPNFYAKDLLKEGAYCFDPVADFALVPIARLFGLCKPMAAYEHRKDENGNPVIEDCKRNNFFIYYTSPEVQTLFRSIYSNTQDIANKYVAFEGVVSRRLSQNPHVIGYDPINEPVGVVKRFAGLLDATMPGQWDNQLLEPFYEKVYKNLQSVDHRNIMFFEATLPDFLSFSVGNVQVAERINPLGYTKAPGNE